MTPARLALVALATLRLTRLLTTDKLPEHLVLRHVRARATHAEDGRPTNLAGYAIELADCPWCGGFWLGAAVLVGDAATRRTPRLRKAWTLGLGALALNWIVGHISSRVDQ